MIVKLSSCLIMFFIHICCYLKITFSVIVIA